MKLSLENRQAQILAIGSFLTTVIVITSTLIEPVNAPKMLILSMTVFALIGLVDFRLPSTLQAKRNVPVTFLSGFFIWLWISTATSSQRFTHNFFGVYGRNSGTLTYSLLAVLFLISMKIDRSETQLKILNALFYAGIFNLGYFVMTLFGFEIFNWNNPTNRVLGTFGNSNFAGAFMAFFSILSLTRVLDSRLSRPSRLFSGVVLFLGLFQIYRSLAVQGYVIFLVGALLICFFKVRESSKKSLKYSFVLATQLVGIIGVFGLLNKGPLAWLIYKPSVTYRGFYWEAAWNTGLANPIFGVGPDSFGIYYRQFRSSASVESVGLNTATDAAHNVFLDMFAYGGFPLFVLYLLLQFVVLVSIIRQVRHARKVDFQFQALVTIWLMYQIQSIVSINQIGLAIWGWVLGGLILARGKNYSSGIDFGLSVKQNSKSKSSQKDAELLPASLVLKMLVGALIGFAIAFPPVLADSRYFQAVKKGDALLVEKYALSWPTNPIRIGDASSIFLNNGYPDKALQLAEIGIQKFPQSFSAWKVLERIPGQSIIQENETKRTLATLDPLDPEYRQ